MRKSMLVAMALMGLVVGLGGCKEKPAETTPPTPKDPPAETPAE